MRRTSIALVICLLAVAGVAASPDSFRLEVGRIAGLIHASHARRFLQVQEFSYPTSTWPNGRFKSNRSDLLALANRVTPDHRAALASSGVGPISIDEGVQTFDLFAPRANNFQPIANVPLSDTNIEPVWTPDNRYMLYAAAMPSATPGAPQQYHIFAVGPNGGTPIQITTGTGSEAYPTITPNGTSFAFTSTVADGKTPELYAITNFNVQNYAANGPVDVGALASLTIRSDLNTGFGAVGRPTWSPDGLRIAFAATETASGHSHIWFLYMGTDGYEPPTGSNPGPSSSNPPAELTAASPAVITSGDDTDPAWSPDGGFIAFASTSSSIATNASSASLGPGNAPTLTGSVSPSGNRTIYVISGGTSASAFGTVPANPAPLSTGNPTGSNFSVFPGFNGSVTAARNGDGSLNDDCGPAWTISPNTYLNPTGSFGYLAWSRGSSSNANHKIFYMRAIDRDVNDNYVVVPENATLQDNQLNGSTVTNVFTVSNTSVKLNTDDNKGEIVETAATDANGAPTYTRTVSAGDMFDDRYPTWSPLTSVNSIAYQSNRSVTYNDLANSGSPVEQAISLGQSTVPAIPAPTTGSTPANLVATAQPGAIVLTWSAPATSPTAYNIYRTTGSTFNTSSGPYATVSGTNPTLYTDTDVAAGKSYAYEVTAVSSGNVESGPSNVASSSPLESSTTVGDSYTGILQSLIVDLDPPLLMPYDAQNVVDVEDGTGTRTQSIQPGSSVTFYVRLSNREAGTDAKNIYLQIKDPESKYEDSLQLEHKVFTSDRPTGLHSNARYLYNAGIAGFNQFTINNVLYPPYNQEGMVAGAKDNTDFYSLIHYNNAATLSTVTPSAFDATQVTQYSVNAQEYECQYINPTVTNKGTNILSASSFGTPWYVAGLDDQTPLSGNNLPPRPATEWIKLTPSSVDANGNPIPDSNGGFIFSASYTTPSSWTSDFYVDVVGYDNATFPALPSDINGTYTGQGKNWRIYDNVGGFTTALPNLSKSILVVSDYALGQKFAATTFGGVAGANDLPPVYYGAESYYTATDITQLPNAVDYWAIPPKATLPTDDVQLLTQPPLEFANPANTYGPVLNGLGPGSYDDGFVDQGVAIDGAPDAPTQDYSIWRVLSRGPVPPSVLANFCSQQEPQPAVNDPVNNNFTAPAADGLKGAGHSPLVPVAHRCVIWVSPYTGDLLVGPGTLLDTTTQQELTAFVDGGSFEGVNFTGGGRLCVSGASVASALTQDGAQNNNPANPADFLPNILNATYVSANQGSFSLTGANAAGARITYDAYFNPAPAIGVNQNFFQRLAAAPFVQYFAPGAEAPMLMANNDIYSNNKGDWINWRTDASLDQMGPWPLNYGRNVINSQISTIAPVNGAHLDVTSGAAPYVTGGNEIVYNENVGPTGGRTVFAASGLEGIGIDIYTLAVPNTNPQETEYIPRNTRANILHNIVTYLRTGTIKGTIAENGQGGGGVPNATVYILSNGGTKIPGTTRQCFSALTDNSGNYEIDGVEPGAYYVSAYKTGFNEASTSQTRTVYTVDANEIATVNLNINPLSPGAVTGVVEDNYGNKLVGATVTFTSSDGAETYTGTTGAGGVFLITGMIPTTYNGVATDTLNGADYLDVKNAANASNVAIASAATTTLTAPLILTAAPGSLGGLVTDATTGAPITGASVTVRDQNNNIVSGTPVTTYSPVTQASSAPNANNNIEGDGNPENYLITAESDALPAGAYTVTASAPGYVTSPTPVTVTVSSAGFSRADIALASSTGSLGGLIYDSVTNQPIANATVTISQGSTVVATLTTSASGASIPTTTGPGGDGRPVNYYAGIENSGVTGAAGALPIGTYTVTVTAANYVYTSATPAAGATVTIVSGQFTRQDFPLASTQGTVGGLITDASTGLPIGGATVTFTPTGGSGSTVKFPTDANGNVTTSTSGSGGDGKSVNYGGLIADGTYTVTIVASNYQTINTASLTPPVTVTVSASSFTRFNYALPSSLGTIGGLVTDASTGLPVQGALVSIKNTSNAVLGTGSTTATTTSPISPVGDGNPINYSISLPQASPLTLTVSAANYQPQTLTVAVIQGQFVRENIKLVTSLGTIGGIVKDAATGNPLPGVSVVITNSSNVVVARLTTASGSTSPAAPNGDGNPINYSTQVPAGAYTVSISKQGYQTSVTLTATVSSDAFDRVDFTGANAVAALQTLSQGWNFFSTPYDYGTAGITWDELLGSLNTGTVTSPSIGSNRSHIYIWNAPATKYVTDPTAPADESHPGYGYWVYLLSPTEITQTGPKSTGTVSVALNEGWNMIGVPSLSSISVSNLTFNNTVSGTPYTFAQASSSALGVVYGTLYGYSGSSGYGTVTSAGSLQPWQAYWIYAYIPTTVNIPTGQ